MIVARFFESVVWGFLRALIVFTRNVRIISIGFLAGSSLKLSLITKMEEFESLQQLYERLIEVTQNELEISSDLLPYQSDVVDYILEQITHMNNVINKTKNKWSFFAIQLHKIELERFSYLINTYLRTRLKKIESNAPRLIQLLRTDIDRANKFLSPPEAKYLDRYSESIDVFMKNLIKGLPENMRRYRLAGFKQRQDANYAFVIGLAEAKINDGDSEVTLEPDVCRILTVPTIIDQLEKGSRLFKLI